MSELEKCSATGKVIHRSRAAAADHCAHLRRNGDAHPYRCHVDGGCGLWHVTSGGRRRKPTRKRSGRRGREAQRNRRR